MIMHTPNGYIGFGHSWVLILADTASEYLLSVNERVVPQSDRVPDSLLH